MSALERQDTGMKEMTISARRTKTKPKYSIQAAALLKACREFYDDPENEKAFQEWKETKKKGA